ncbi:MAG TPA: VWA domain-containing protein, partial [Thermoanaerobaculia bacterium]|nr:VWA domain-containing protein [Thermoanaerobaculia bacterium]
RPRFASRRSLGLSLGLALVLGAGLLLQPPLSGQTGEGTYGSFLDRVEVEVVEVDVLVVDREGQPVRDLGRDEFELLVDGEPVEIGYFTPPPAAAATAPVPPSPTGAGEEPAPAETGEAPAAEPTTLVAYIDETAIRPGQRNQILEAFGRVLAERLAAGDQVLVARFDEGLRLLTDLTTDPATVQAALARAAKRAPASLLSQLEEAALLQDLESAEAGAGGGAGGRSSGAEDAEAMRLRAELESRASFEADRQRQATASLADLVGALGGIPGRKTVLLGSGGFLSRPAARLGEIWQQRFAAFDPGSALPGDELDSEAGGLQHAFSRLLRTAQTTRVTFVTIEAGDTGSSLPDASFGGGLEAASSLAAGTAGLEASGSLGVLAAATGGRRLKLEPRIASALSQVGAELDARYSLGFPTGPEAGSRFHRIEVRVLRDGLRVQHREGFRRRAGADRALDALLATAALGGGENAMGVTVETGEPRKAQRGRHSLVPVVVKVPLRAIALLPEANAQSGRLRFTFALRDPSDRVVQLEPRPLAFSVPNADLAAALRQVVSMSVEVPVGSGPHRLAVGVHDEIGDARSTLILPLAVAKSK